MEGGSHIESERARLHWFCYVSVASPGVGRESVDDILLRSRQRNQALGLSGVLLFTGVHFAQVLEGAPDQLDPVVRDILADPRHREVRVLARGVLPRRRFRRWSLALVDHAGRADLIADLHESPVVDADRVRRLVGGLFVRGADSG